MNFCNQMNISETDAKKVNNALRKQREKIALLDHRIDELTASLNRQREGLVNLIELNIIHQDYIKSAQTEIDKIDEVLKCAN